MSHDDRVQVCRGSTRTSTCDVAEWEQLPAGCAMQPHNATSQLTDTRPASDAVLAKRAASGDEQAFVLIMRRYNPRLFRSARSLLPSDADAEDALQEAWIRAWRALGQFRAEARLSTWLTRIVINEALGRLRGKKSQNVPLDTMTHEPDNRDSSRLNSPPERGPDAEALRAQLRRLVEARIDDLPEDFRPVFMLRAVEQMDVAEVAEILGIPEATVRSRHFRARKLLRAHLDADLQATLGDIFAFDGDRCDRMVAAVLARGRACGLSR